MKAEETLRILEEAPAKALMTKLYGKEQAEKNTDRYRDMIEKFKKAYGDKDILMFSYIGNLFRRRYDKKGAAVYREPVSSSRNRMYSRNLSCTCLCG